MCEPDDEPVPRGERIDPEGRDDELDEVGVRLGPDRDGDGLFDPPRESSMVGEKTSVATDEVAPSEPERTLLAWISESAALLANAPESGVPCRPLRQRIADEPPDLLPALGAPALLHRAGSKVLRPPPTAPSRSNEPDDTNTQIRPMPRPTNGASAREDDPPTNERSTTGDRDTGTDHTQTGSFVVASDRVLRLARWLALGLLSVSAAAWWFLGQ